MPDFGFLPGTPADRLGEAWAARDCGHEFATTPAQALGVAEELAHLENSPVPLIAAPEHLAALGSGWERMDYPFVVTAPYVTDKVRQGYMPVYEDMAARIGPAGRVCEVGVWFGGSLATWQVLFPGGIVVGVDSDAECRWPPGTVKIVASQDGEDLPAALLDASPEGYDLIVDDASHDGKLTRRTWELLWPLVRPGGWYVIEDWFTGLGHHPWEGWGDSMLRTAEAFLPLLASVDCDPQSIEYRYGMIIMHRRGG